MDTAITWKAAVQAIRRSCRDGVDPLVGTLELADLDECLQALTEHLRGCDRLELIGGQEGQRLVQQGQAVRPCSAADEDGGLEGHAQRLDVWDVELLPELPSLRGVGHGRVQIACGKRYQACGQSHNAVCGAALLALQQSTPALEPTYGNGGLV